MSIWGLVPDLSKLGSSLGEALQKAKDDMEKNIDSSLGIGGILIPTAETLQTTALDVKPLDSAAPLLAVQAATDPDKSSAAAGSTSGNDPSAASPAAATGKVMRKVIRKVIKKVVKPAAGVDQAAASAGPSNAAPEMNPISDATEDGIAQNLSQSSTAATSLDQHIVTLPELPLSSPNGPFQGTPLASMEEQQGYLTQPCSSESKPQMSQESLPGSIVTQHAAPYNVAPAAATAHLGASTSSLPSDQHHQDADENSSSKTDPVTCHTPAEEVLSQAVPVSTPGTSTPDDMAADQPFSHYPDATENGSASPLEHQTQPHAATLSTNLSPYKSHPSHSSSGNVPSASVPAQTQPTHISQHSLGPSTDDACHTGAAQQSESGLVSESRSEEWGPEIAESRRLHQNGHLGEVHGGNGSDSNDEFKPESLHGDRIEADSPSGSSSNPSPPLSPPPTSSELSQQQTQGALLHHAPSAPEHSDPLLSTKAYHPSESTATRIHNNGVLAPLLRRSNSSGNPLSDDGGGGDSSSGGVLDGNGAVPSPQLDAPAIGNLQAQVSELSRQVATREAQLLKQATQMSELQQVVAQLQDKNEQLVLQSVKVSENDLEELRSEFEVRLAASERKVYALSKERDALRKGGEKLSEYGATIREREEHIKQLMGEGEKLSRKHAELETSLRKLRSSSSEVAADRDRLVSRLAAEEASSEVARKARAKAERDLATAEAAAKSEAEAGKEALEAAMAKAKLEQTESEERARESAALGVARQLKDSEARCAALAESVGELREALDRQRQAADLREEMLKADISDLERRSNAAEMRHQDLTAKLPDAMRPLLRQIEAMQAAAQAQAEAWSGAERTLEQRISESESQAAAAMEKERLGADRTSVLHSKVQSLEGALAAARAEVRSLAAALEAGERSVDEARESCREMAHQVELLQERGRIMGLQMAQAALSASELLTTERGLRDEAENDAATVRKECERRLVDSESSPMDSRGVAHMSRHDGPTMAAPGYRWVLLKEGQESPPMHSPSSPSHASHPSPHPHHQHTINATSRGFSPNSPHPNGSSSHKLRSHSEEDSGNQDNGFNQDPHSTPFSTTSHNQQQHSSQYSHPNSQQHHQQGENVVNLGVSRSSSTGDQLLRSLARSSSNLSTATGGHEGGGNGAHRPLTSAEMEGLRASLRQKTGEVAALEVHVRELEATRDRLAEELVSSSHKIEAAADSLSAMERMRVETEEVRVRYAAAVELLGERDERLEELSADLRDVKSLYQDQIEFFVLQLSELQPPVHWDPVVEGESLTGGGNGGQVENADQSLGATAEKGLSSGGESEVQL